jgi:alcohol dehydrogenase class IV
VTTGFSLQGERRVSVKQFYLPTRIVTGLGCISGLAEVTQGLGQRALFVCGSKALRRAGTLDRALHGLHSAAIETVLFDAVQGEPTLDVVQAALDLARQKGVEVVIGMGGGSAIDVGKATAALYNKPGTVRDYHGGRPISEPGIPFVSVPTTAGTGSEVTNNAVLIDPQGGVKRSIRGTRLYAAAAIVDPELTLSLPAKVTASSGADALCQAIESFTAQGAQPATDALAGQAILRIGRSLVRAWQQGSDITARTDMLYGSLLAGMSMTNTRLGGAHGLAHPLGFHYHIPHGVVCGLLLPYVMEYSLEYAPQKYAAVAALLGVNTRGMSAEEAAREALSAVRAILDTINIPSHLSALGVKVESFATIVQESLPSANVRNNARPLEADDLQIILERAY